MQAEVDSHQKALRPIVIGHRGASGYRPEHTLASYQLAIDQGADFVEPDLVITKDGVLVARHENEISGTTDVGERGAFSGRRTTKVIDGKRVSGWFTEDFTLAELKTLRARERLPSLRPDNLSYDGQFEIPTLQEIIDLVRANESEPAGKRIGIYPETKHPTYFRKIGLPLEEPLVEVLEANGYSGRDALVFIQSFEVSNLRALRKITDVPLIQLIDAGGGPFDLTESARPLLYADLVSPSGLTEVASYADGIGAHKDLFVPRDASNRLLPATSLVDDAHAAGLLAHAWTFRRENYFLAEDHRRGDAASPAFLRLPGDLPAELRLFLHLGIDGLFSDNPDCVAEAIKGNLAQK